MRPYLELLLGPRRPGGLPLGGPLGAAGFLPGRIGGELQGPGAGLLAFELRLALGQVPGSTIITIQKTKRTLLRIPCLRA